MSFIIKSSLAIGTILLFLAGQGYSYPFDLYGAPVAYYYPADAGMAIYDNYDDGTDSVVNDGLENQNTSAVDPSSEIIGSGDGHYYPINQHQRTKRQWRPSIIRLPYQYYYLLQRRTSFIFEFP